MAKVHDNATDLITFSRSSSGTALRRVGYGENLVDNGDFTSGLTSWNDTAVTNSGGTVSVSVEGEVTVTRGTARAEFYQVITTEIGKVYGFNGSVVSQTAGAAIWIGSERNNASDLNISGPPNGLVSGQFVATDTSLYVTLVVGGQEGDANTFDNISVKEVIFDRATDPLVLFNHPDDIPRIEYGSDGALKGLLIEEQRTNLFTHSEDFTATTGAWTGTNIVPPANDATGPDNVMNSATTLTEDTSASAEHYISKTIVGLAAGTYTSSIFVKMKDTSTRTKIRLRNLNFVTSGNHADFDLSAGTVTKGLSADSATIENVGSGWFRCSVTSTSTVQAAAIIRVFLLDDSGALSYTGDGASGVLIYGAQLEEGSFATSYIPTSGSQETRWADVASIPVSAFGYNDQAGTWVVNWTNGPDVTDDQQYLLFITGPVGNLVYSNAGTTSSYAYDGSNVLGHGGWVADQEQTLAVAMSPTEAVSSLDGAAVNSSAHNGNLTADRGRTLYLGDRATTPRPLNGHIKSLKYYPRRLTDAQLQELTA